MYNIKNYENVKSFIFLNCQSQCLVPRTSSAYISFFLVYGGNYLNLHQLKTAIAADIYYSFVWVVKLESSVQGNCSSLWVLHSFTKLAIGKIDEWKVQIDIWFVSALTLVIKFITKEYLNLCLFAKTTLMAQCLPDNFGGTYPGLGKKFTFNMTYKDKMYEKCWYFESKNVHLF